MYQVELPALPRKLGMVVRPPQYSQGDMRLTPEEFALMSVLQHPTKTQWNEIYIEQQLSHDMKDGLVMTSF